MDFSITIIGLVLSFLIAIPILYSIRSNSLNKSKIKHIKNQFSQNNHFNFDFSETLNKKVLALDQKNKGLLLMDFNPKTEHNSFINLNEVQSCKLIATTKSEVNTIIKIELEFLYKETKKTESICFYNIENDQMGQICLHEDHEFAKKWKLLLDNCIY